MCRKTKDLTKSRGLKGTGIRDLHVWLLQLRLDAAQDRGVSR